MTPNTFVTFSSQLCLSGATDCKDPGYFAGVPSLYCFCILVCPKTMSGFSWMTKSTELGIHWDKNQCSYRDGCLTKFWLLLSNPLQIPVYPRMAISWATASRGFTVPFATSEVCVCVSHHLFNPLGDSGSLLQYSNPLHTQTSEWVIPCFWVWRKCTMKLQRLLLCKPWGEGFQVLMAGAPFLHRAHYF